LPSLASQHKYIPVQILLVAIHGFCTVFWLSMPYWI